MTPRPPSADRCGDAKRPPDPTASVGASARVARVEPACPAAGESATRSRPIRAGARRPSPADRGVAAARRDERDAVAVSSAAPAQRDPRARAPAGWAAPVGRPRDLAVALASGRPRARPARSSPGDPSGGTAAMPIACGADPGRAVRGEPGVARTVELGPGAAAMRARASPPADGDGDRQRRAADRQPRRAAHGRRDGAPAAAPGRGVGDAPRRGRSGAPPGLGAVAGAGSPARDATARARRGSGRRVGQDAAPRAPACGAGPIVLCRCGASPIAAAPAAGPCRCLEAAAGRGRWPLLDRPLAVGERAGGPGIVAPAPRPAGVAASAAGGAGRWSAHGGATRAQPARARPIDAHAAAARPSRHARRPSPPRGADHPPHRGTGTSAGAVCDWLPARWLWRRDRGRAQPRASVVRIVRGPGRQPFGASLELTALGASAGRHGSAALERASGPARRLRSPLPRPCGTGRDTPLPRGERPRAHLSGGRGRSAAAQGRAGAVAIRRERAAHALPGRAVGRATPDPSARLDIGCPGVCAADRGRDDGTRPAVPVPPGVRLGGRQRGCPRGHLMRCARRGPPLPLTPGSVDPHCRPWSAPRPLGSNRSAPARAAWADGHLLEPAVAIDRDARPGAGAPDPSRGRGDSSAPWRPARARSPAAPARRSEPTGWPATARTSGAGRGDRARWRAPAGATGTQLSGHAAWPPPRAAGQRHGGRPSGLLAARGGAHGDAARARRARGCPSRGGTARWLPAGNGTDAEVRR